MRPDQQVVGYRWLENVQVIRLTDGAAVAEVTRKAMEEIVAGAAKEMLVLDWRTLRAKMELENVMGAEHIAFRFEIYGTPAKNLRST